MLQTVKQVCTFNPIIHDYQMNEGIENLSELISGQGDGRDFFARNYVTSGMEQLFREGLQRLSGQSGQAVFELAQAMGGGKTHMMVALGLLARHPHLRGEVLDAELAEKIGQEPVRVAAFNGRNNPEEFIWGEIGKQLGEADAIRPFWIDGPKAVDEKTWKEIIGDKPTLIMLDELPPYLSNAATVLIGGGTLASVTMYTLSCLLSAALSLPRCCVVIANLSNSYERETKDIRKMMSRAGDEAISNLGKEVQRQARVITPVSLEGNEVTEILKKRLITQLPGQEVVREVAAEYAKSIKKAEDGGYIAAASLVQIEQEVISTYPFHPSYKHIVALFKENESFRQTRGLMQFTARLLKSVANRAQDDVYLIGAQHLDLNDDAVREEVSRIANNLRPALAHDVADKGNAVAELIDKEVGGDAAERVATLLLASSLSRAVQGRIGLTESEVIEFMAAPCVSSEAVQNAIAALRKRSWYMHREGERLFIRETENLGRRIEREADDIKPDKVINLLEARLKNLLEPSSKLAYQRLLVMPKLEDIRLNGPRTLIVMRPDSKQPPELLNMLFTMNPEQNNFMVLTGQHSYMADEVEKNLRVVGALEAICKTLQASDSLYEDASDRLKEAQAQLLQSISGAYNRLYYPHHDDYKGQDDLAFVTLENGLRTGQGEHSAERQIEKVLASATANYKLILDLNEGDAFGDVCGQSEAYLWPSSDRRVPWRDMVDRARNQPIFLWLPGTSGLDALKAEALRQGRWRDNGDGYIEKGPFPKEKTSVAISSELLEAEGAIRLRLTPRHAGPNPVVHYAANKDVSTNDPVVDDCDDFKTTEGTLYFLVVDPQGQHESGEPKRWVADLRVRHQPQSVADTRTVVLECLPAASLRYTLDGTNPRDGVPYNDPFEIGAGAYMLQVFASLGEAETTARFDIPAQGNRDVVIKDSQPARLAETKRVDLDNTQKVFGVIKEFKGKPETTFRGVRLELGEGVEMISVNLGEREVNAATLDAIISGLTQAIGGTPEHVAVKIRSGASFTTGFDAKTFAKLGGFALGQGDVIQES